MSVSSQRGLVLLFSLVWGLLLGMLGVSVMASAIQQERMAHNLKSVMQTFERAQRMLQKGEATASAHRPPCGFCLPPPEAGYVTAAGVYSGVGASSGLAWLAAEDGLYLIQSLGQSTKARLMPSEQPVNLYRVTAVARNGPARSVLESVIAQPVGPEHGQWRRILWRQVY
ncbi:pilus assembly protein PilX [Pseudomonas sp. GD03860]|uniref:pilus assembly PilX family protein n=1 Tax=Pseudomonas TaxID=286 RepID=UPI002364769C|nr:MULTISPECIES: pilus assembly protein PilX [Pseudomonas]MDD2057351.1 pilus assembly protein PilX [Pseudomonas putida]MDH0640310.1 pilus assembly protein PilX [Pseudomonas sp. GD03860]